MTDRSGIHGRAKLAAAGPQERVGGGGRLGAVLALMAAAWVRGRQRPRPPRHSTCGAWDGTANVVVVSGLDGLRRRQFRQPVVRASRSRLPEPQT